MLDLKHAARQRGTKGFRIALITEVGLRCATEAQQKAECFELSEARRRIQLQWCQTTHHKPALTAEITLS